MITSSVSNWDIWGSISSPLTSIAKSAKRVALKVTKFSVALSAIQNVGVQAKGLNQDIIQNILLGSSTAGPGFASIFRSFFTDGNLPIGSEKTLITALKVLQSGIEDSFLSSYEDYANLRIPDCFSSDCPDIDQIKVYPREKQATEVIYETVHWFKSRIFPPEWIEVQEFLRFRKDDPREKLLYVSAAHDYNGALEPRLVSGILGILSLKYDVKFIVTNRHEDIRKAIESGSRTGTVGNVFIDAHGDPTGIAFDQGKDENGLWYSIDKMSDETDFARSFSDMQLNGKIVLLSCSTGKEEVKGFPFFNIAQKIAEGSKRTVIAPTDNVYPLALNFLNEDDLTLFHRRDLRDPHDKKNIYTAFRPNYEHCFPKIDEKNLTEREKKVREVVKTTFFSRNLLHEKTNDQFFNQYFQICSDNPRDSLLYFSAQYDKNKALDPENNSKPLSVFADRSDLFFIEVGSFEDICSLVGSIAEIKKIAAIVIDAHGSPEKGIILSKDQSGQEKMIDTSSDFSRCFSKIKKDDVIIAFMGGSIGQSRAFVQKVAAKANQTVIAPTCPIQGNDVVVQSTEPLELYRPGYSFFSNLFTKGCKENNANHFKTFRPSKPQIHEEL